MNILSTIYKTSLIILILAVLPAIGADRAWPVKGEIDISSTFCDYRVLHFHGGIDIRTGGTEGRRVYSPVDGYIWRIKYSYTGYGKAVYVLDNQGFIYVFGHLSGLSDRLEKIVREIQYSQKRYYLDSSFSRNQIPVKQGELIALSGQTGFGGPHLHFEVRNPQNMPLNPLTNGFPLTDNFAPVFDGLALAYQDTVSLFPDGRRRILLEPRRDKSGGKYQIDSPVLIQGPFGVAAKIIERIRPNGPRLNILKAKLFIDDYLHYDGNFDQYDYEQTAMVDLTYDYFLATATDQSWLLLFEPGGKVFSGSSSQFEKGGVFTGRTSFSYGLHNGRVEIYDAAGNMSELDFKFVWAPKILFDVGRVNDSTLYLRAGPDTRYIDIGGIAVHAVGSGENVQRLDSTLVESMGSGDFKISLPGNLKRTNGFRLDVIGESGWVYTQEYVPSHSYGESQYGLDYELIDGGILFEVHSRDKFSPAPEVDLVYEDGYVKKIQTRVVSPFNFAAFYKNNCIKTRIIRIDLMDRGGSLPLLSVETNIILAGGGSRQTGLSVPGVIEVGMPGNAFYSPALVELRRADGKFNQSSSIIGDAYEIGPETMPLAKNIFISMTLDGKTDNSKVGFYRLNSKHQWKWLDSKILGNKLNSESSLTGTFAAIKDIELPHIRKINPGNGTTVKSDMPLIKCNVRDELSDIEDDKSITITLDGEWLIPEYDPETELLKTTPRKALKNGRHDVVIKVSDRVGNERIVNTHFFVNKD